MLKKQIFKNSFLNADAAENLPHTSTNLAQINLLIVIEGFLSPTGRNGFENVVNALLEKSVMPPVNVHFAVFGTSEDTPTSLTEDDGATEQTVRFRNFRFNSEVNGKQIINRYDLIWCFGANPFGGDDYNNPNKNKTDNDLIKNSPSSSSKEEIRAISEWMDSGGGLLAAGDHGFIGSAMNWNIPRSGSMRAWLRSDDLNHSVTDMSGEHRYDSNRPSLASNIIRTNNQGDSVPQEIHWIDFGGQPHPILSYKKNMVVDVFPDHAHEGRVLINVNLGNVCWHDENKQEFPTINGIQPTPDIIAFGRVLGKGYMYPDKGVPIAQSFPLISVYDGHMVSIGRVVVDSTWHHWMDVNISNLTGDDKEKITSLATNTAIWMLGQNKQRDVLMHWLLDYTFSIDNFEEIISGGEPLSIGKFAMNKLVEAINAGTLGSVLDSVVANTNLNANVSGSDIANAIKSKFHALLVGCVVSELALVRDLVLSPSNKSISAMQSLPENWVSEAFGLGVERATSLMMDEVEKEISFLQGLKA